MSKACLLGVVERAVVDLAVLACEVPVICVVKAQVVDMSG